MIEIDSLLSINKKDATPRQNLSCALAKEQLKDIKQLEEIQIELPFDFFFAKVHAIHRNINSMY